MAACPRYFQISLPVQPGNSGGALVGIVAAKVLAHGHRVRRRRWRPPGAAGVLADGHQVNYAVKSSLLLSFLESVPDVAAKRKQANTKEESFEEVVKSAQEAAVLVLVY
jgi:hypothetical protein